jgi:ABC-type antimicrobial peptide transport system permease subunit
LEAPVPTIYRALGQDSPYIAVLVVRTRTAVDPAGFAQKLLSVDPVMVSPTVATLRALMEKNTTRARLTMEALVALAGVALVLAIAGVFAVVSYGVSLRTHEFGIRMALGSTAARIHRDVVTRAMRVSAIGIVAGTLLAAMVVRIIPLSLTTIEPLDVPTFAAVVVLMTIAALVAALIPALRATRVDPTVALRSE